MPCLGQTGGGIQTRLGRVNTPYFAGDLADVLYWEGHAADHFGVRRFCKTTKKHSVEYPGTETKDKYMTSEQEEYFSDVPLLVLILARMVEKKPAFDLEPVAGAVKKLTKGIKEVRKSIMTCGNNAVKDGFIRRKVEENTKTPHTPASSALTLLMHFVDSLEEPLLAKKSQTKLVDLHQQYSWDDGSSHGGGGEGAAEGDYMHGLHGLPRWALSRRKCHYIRQLVYILNEADAEDVLKYAMIKRLFSVFHRLVQRDEPLDISISDYSLPSPSFKGVGGDTGAVQPSTVPPSPSGALDNTSTRKDVLALRCLDMKRLATLCDAAASAMFGIRSKDPQDVRERGLRSMLPFQKDESRGKKATSTDTAAAQAWEAAYNLAVRQCFCVCAVFYDAVFQDRHVEEDVSSVREGGGAPASPRARSPGGDGRPSTPRGLGSGDARSQRTLSVDESRRADSPPRSASPDYRGGRRLSTATNPGGTRRTSTSPSRSISRGFPRGFAGLFTAGAAVAAALVCAARAHPRLGSIIRKKPTDALMGAASFQPHPSALRNMRKNSGGAPAGPQGSDGAVGSPQLNERSSTGGRFSPLLQRAKAMRSGGSRSGSPTGGGGRGEVPPGAPHILPQSQLRLPGTDGESSSSPSPSPRRQGNDARRALRSASRGSADGDGQRSPRAALTTPAAGAAATGRPAENTHHPEAQERQHRLCVSPSNRRRLSSSPQVAVSREPAAGPDMLPPKVQRSSLGGSDVAGSASTAAPAVQAPGEPAEDGAPARGVPGFDGPDARHRDGVGSGGGAGGESPDCRRAVGSPSSSGWSVPTAPPERSISACVLPKTLSSSIDMPATGPMRWPQALADLQTTRLRSDSSATGTPSSRRPTGQQQQLAHGATGAVPIIATKTPPVESLPVAAGRPGDPYTPLTPTLAAGAAPPGIGATVPVNSPISPATFDGTSVCTPVDTPLSKSAGDAAAASYPQRHPPPHVDPRAAAPLTLPSAVVPLAGGAGGVSNFGQHTAIATNVAAARITSSQTSVNVSSSTIPLPAAPMDAHVLTLLDRADARARDAEATVARYSKKVRRLVKDQEEAGVEFAKVYRMLKESQERQEAMTAKLVQLEGERAQERVERAVEKAERAAERRAAEAVASEVAQLRKDFTEEAAKLRADTTAAVARAEEEAKEAKAVAETLQQQQQEQHAQHQPSQPSSRHSPVELLAGDGDGGYLSQAAASLRRASVGGEMMVPHHAGGGGSQGASGQFDLKAFQIMDLEHMVLALKKENAGLTQEVALLRMDVQRAKRDMADEGQDTQREVSRLRNGVRVASEALEDMNEELQSLSSLKEAAATILDPDTPLQMSWLREELSRVKHDSDVTKGQVEAAFAAVARLERAVEPRNAAPPTPGSPAGETVPTPLATWYTRERGLLR